MRSTKCGQHIKRVRIEIYAHRKCIYKLLHHMAGSRALPKKQKKKIDETNENDKISTEAMKNPVETC